jgi:hypothetical protein
LETRGKTETPRPAKPAKVRASQTALFEDPSSLLDAVRKELQSLAEILK